MTEQDQEAADRDCVKMFSELRELAEALRRPQPWLIPRTPTPRNVPERQLRLPLDDD
jgi:hypothetical protein